MCLYVVMYPEFFGGDQYIHQIQEGAEFFFQSCAFRWSKNAHPGPVSS